MNNLKRPIKLVFAISLYEINGACAVAKNLIEGLNKQDFKIVLIAEKIGKRHFKLGSDIKIVNLDIQPQKGLVRKILNIISHISKIRKAILAENPDIILSFGTILNCYILFSLRKDDKRDIKVIISEHSEGFLINYKPPHFKDRISRKFYKLMMFLSYKKADSIVAVSQSIAKSLKRLLGIDNKIKVIYNPVDLIRIKKLSEEEIKGFNFETNVPYISTISRLSPEKGIDYLLRAFAELVRNVGCKLIIIGDGSYRESLENLASDLNISNKVAFMGYMDNPYKYLKKSSIFVLPSLYEGIPNVILESYACEIPVIATKCVSSIEELIEDGKDGLLVKPRNVDELYIAMENLLSNITLRERLKLEGSKTVKKFDVSIISNEYQDLFLAVLGRGSRN